MNFYTIVLIIAIVLLILSLTALSLMLTKVGTTTAFPPISNTCPDGWTSGKDSSGNITCTSDKTNKPSRYDVNSAYSKNSPGYINYYYSSDPKFLGGVTSIPGATTISINKGIVKNVCDQKTWSDANKIIWDGVTNSNASC
jgi:ABC-type antimicrobial peptide transport system permease subunit